MAPCIFAGDTLDRVGEQRGDAEWVAARSADPGAQFLPVWRGRVLIENRDGQSRAALLPRNAVEAYLGLGERSPWALLGLRDGAPVFAIDLSAWDAPLAGAPEFTDLRAIAAAIAPAEAAMLGHARALMHWRTRHRRCGVCGAGCAPDAAGHVMRCQGCGADHFPRTDTAVIMLVHRAERVLLARPKRAGMGNMMTVLAGFLEPGESLEEAVAREVFEEVGLRIGPAQYVASQPWPFPANLMAGFFAEAGNGPLTIAKDELEEVGWFTCDQLLDPAGFTLPPDLSIARRLIDRWVAGA